MIDNKILAVKVKKQTSVLLYSIFRYALLISIGYIVIFPIVSAFTTAIKDEKAFFDATLELLPRYISFKSFEAAFNALDYVQGLIRTLTLCIVSAVIEIVMCAVVAYGFARFNFKFKKIFDFLLMATIVIPVQVYIVSMVVNFKYMDFAGILGLVNDLTGVDLRPNILNTSLTFYLPSLFAKGLSSGILIYIYIQLFSSLPKELEEAAYIDGAGPFKTFWRIAVPSSSVVIITVSVFAIIWHWNEYYLPVIYMSENYPLAVRLAEIGSTLSVNNPFVGAASTVMKNATQMAACILFIVPVLIGYLCIQNKFVKSIDRVGITG